MCVCVCVCVCVRACVLVLCVGGVRAHQVDGAVARRSLALTLSPPGGWCTSLSLSLHLVDGAVARCRRRGGVAADVGRTLRERE
jgi:hypothetical protein